MELTISQKILIEKMRKEGLTRKDIQIIISRRLSSKVSELEKETPGRIMV